MEGCIGGPCTSGSPLPDLSRSAILGPARLDQRGPGMADEDRMRRGRLTTRKTTGTTEDSAFLQTPDTSFIDTDPWRALRILAEFVEGFDALATAPPAVSVFGSARITDQDPEYAAAREVGTELANAGFSVITGGGPGAMEAANRGC